MKKRGTRVLRHAAGYGTYARVMGELPHTVALDIQDGRLICGACAWPLIGSASAKREAIKTIQSQNRELIGQEGKPE